MLKRRASATWAGNFQEGNGTVSATSGVLNNTPFSFKTRLVSEDGSAGTNPEELLAAAHAGCFTMAVSVALGQAGFTADKLETKAVLTLDTEKLDVTAVELNLTGSIPGIDAAKFQELAEGAKKNCIISKALNPGIDITLNATLA